MGLTTSMLDIENRCDTDEYEAFLDAVPNTLVQQSITWCRVVSDISPDEPFILVVRDGRVLMGALVIYLYRNRLGNILYSNPHAGSIGSLVLHPEAPKESVLKLLIDAVLRLSRQYDCLTVTLTSNPFAGEDVLANTFSCDYILTNTVQYLDLDNCFDKKGELVVSNSKFRNNLRRQLRRARQKGLKVIVSDSRDHLEKWYEVHLRRISELKGSAIPYKLFRNALETAVTRNRSAFLYVFCGDRIIGGGLHIYSKQIVDLFMLSTTREGQKIGANYLLIAKALHWARDNGLCLYNWQASNPPDGGIAQFKQQWGSQKAVYHYYTKVMGDLGPIWRAGLEKVRQAYNWHYVLPYGAFSDPERRKFSKMDSPVFWTCQ